MGDLLLVRHGETAWSLSGQHTGLTDVPLTAHGEEQAVALAGPLGRRDVVAAFCSPLQRARRTAELAGLSAHLDADLVEWDYGSYEGRTSSDVHEERPGWWLWTDGAPGGESWQDLQARCERVVARAEPLLAAGDVVLVGHGHALRALAAVWVGLPAHSGGIFTLDPATLSVLGHYQERRVVERWNEDLNP